MNKHPASAKKGKPKIFLVDDHFIVREGLKQLIHAKGDYDVCGEAESGEQALERLPIANPDLAIFDLGLQGTMNGLDLIKLVKQKLPNLPILVMSMYEENVYAERAFKAGAKGYIMKKGHSEELLKAIRQILNGKIYASDQVTEKMMETATGHRPAGPSVENLTDREFEVFQFIGRGFKTGAIADELHVSVKTVESYREEIKNKLQLPGASELTQYAVNWMHKNRIDS
jgi:DNA-binding NarL/FixJ family response regulator